jgi:hypothetical protein
MFPPVDHSVDDVLQRLVQALVRDQLAEQGAPHAPNPRMSRARLRAGDGSSIAFTALLQEPDEVTAATLIGYLIDLTIHTEHKVLIASGTHVIRALAVEVGKATPKMAIHGELGFFCFDAQGRLLVERAPTGHWLAAFLRAQANPAPLDEESEDCLRRHGVHDVRSWIE